MRSDAAAVGRPIAILLVEDNENDVMLTRLGFKKARLMVNLHHVRDGIECMEFLRREGDYAHADAPMPDLILLDLNMPRMGGREVMAEIVADERLRHLPVVILTTSAEEREILDMYKLRCSSYIVKPVDFDKFVRVIQTLGEYWFTVVVLPPGQHPG
jgi:two-component system response regulator